MQGPIAEPRCFQDEELYTVCVDDIIIKSGTPVICHGLEGTLAHLNGKIGDVRSYEEERDRYEVGFEDKNLQPRLVKQSNIRILFELPNIE